MLKQWVASGEDLMAIDIEEKYKLWTAELRTDRYITRFLGLIGVDQPFVFGNALACLR